MSKGKPIQSAACLGEIISTPFLGCANIEQVFNKKMDIV